MITLAECVALSELTEDEVAVIAEHERVPMIVAVGIGERLLTTPKGVFRLKGYICDLLEHAHRAGDEGRARHFDRILIRFIREHPVSRVL
jgi:hypothetical protein